MEKASNITGTTRMVGLVGHPVANSVSPELHNAVFEKMGYDFVYTAHDVERDNLETAVRGMEALGYLGYNVTSPYKKAIVPYLHEVSTVAEIMGAVNTVTILNGRSLGDNADGAAFMRNLVMNGVNVLGKKITVLGTGGAASAVVVQAALDGVAQIDVFNRNDKFLLGFRETMSRLEAHCECQVNQYPLENEEQLRSSIAESTLLVNATNVGTLSNPGCLVQESMLRPELIVADMVYLPRETELLAMAAKKGCKVVDGVGVFIQQAAIAERQWCGCEMPVSFVMETLLFC